MSGITILHASDLQVGKPFRPRAGEAFRNLAFDVMPHLIVVSGDVTQRAKGREFKAAWELLQRLPSVPLVVTPGNHDVPLYRIWERALMPWFQWKRHIPRDLDSVARVAGAMVVGLNSAAPHRAIVNGRIRRRQLSFARRAFESGPPGGARILVIHHNLVRPRDGEDVTPLPHARRILRQIEEMEADLVLGGHLHRTYVTTSREVLPGEQTGVPLIYSGTTTSRRGREPERRRNACNLIQLMEETVEVTPHYFESRGTAFEPGETLILPRAGLPLSAGPAGSAPLGS